MYFLVRLSFAELFLCELKGYMLFVWLMNSGDYNTQYHHTHKCKSFMGSGGVYSSCGGPSV